MNRVAHLLIQEFTLPPGDEWTGQLANWWFLHITAGECYWLGPEKARSLSAGEALVIAPDVPAIIRASQLTQTTIKGFTFGPEDILGLFTLAERHSFETELATSLEPVRFFPFPHPVARRLAALLPSLPGHNALRQRAEALAIVAAVFDGNAPSDHSPDSLGTCARQRFQRLITEMSEVDLIRSTPAELARLCRCSTAHLTRLFRRHFGTPLRARQDELRLLRACHLLRATDSPIAAIAQSCGYPDSQALNLRFKARFGVWPSRWRQQLRGAERPIPIDGAASSPALGIAENHRLETPCVTDS